MDDATAVTVDDVRITVNGRELPFGAARVHTSALDWLRDQGLTGAKEGCAEGECGACSVLVARPDPTDAARTRWTALNACLVPAAALDGQEVVTAEGLGTVDALHPVQREMAVRGGSQCGYCTPGFVCSMAAEYYRPGRVDGEAVGETGAEAAVEAGAHEHGEVGPNGFDLHALSGNLCRCTGYRPIRDAAYALEAPADGDLLAVRLGSPAPAARTTRVTEPDGRFVRPGDLAEALAILREHPDAVPVAGSTDHGVEVNLRGLRPSYVVALDRLPELRELVVGEEAIEVGAALTLSEVESMLAAAGARVPLLEAVLPQFASRLIRNGATLGGNLGTASPIGDTSPALLALGAHLVLASADGEREVALADYFTGYRTTLRRPDELIRSVRVPLPLAGVTGFHKVAKRRFDDISGVAVALALDVVDATVVGARIGLGGVAATPLRATATEEALVGQPWTAATVAAAAQVLASEGTPLDDQRASAAYRSAMLGQALPRLWHESGAGQ
jgi:xanthine dehydrogenase small subunit